MYNIDDEPLKYITQQVRSFYYGEKEINEEVIADLVNVGDATLGQNRKEINYL